METPERPCVSVIIPTYGRPKLLQRAIDSCRGISPGGVEVIVVSNGEIPCALEPHHAIDFQVRIIESVEANANIARNIGLASARGRFVRFLDDDDYLFASGAVSQYVLAESAAADICSGAVQIVDHVGNLLQTILPSGQDFASTVLAPNYGTLTTSHLYRREFLQGLIWNPTRKHLQDVEWMHGIVRRSEVNWITLKQAVGVWQHHQHERISTGALKRFPDLALKEVETIVNSTTENLADQGRLSPARMQASAESLWHCVHHGFPLDPIHWHRTGVHALTLDPASRPRIELYHRMPWKYFPPLVLEWCFYPYRRLRMLLMNRSFRNS